MQILKKSRSGFTLVELMVVVAIVGILASLGSIGYTRYIRAAQMEELDQIAKEFAAGQQRFRSRQNAFYPLSAGTKTWAADEEQIKALLEVRSRVPDDIRIRMISWTGTGSPGSPGCGFCQGLGDTSTAGFLIGVQRDFDGSQDPDDPMFVITNDMVSVRFNEGNN